VAYKSRFRNVLYPGQDRECNGAIALDRRHGLTHAPFSYQLPQLGRGGWDAQDGQGIKGGTHQLPGVT